MKTLLLAGRILSVLMYLVLIIVWIATGAWWWLLIYLLLHVADMLLFGLRIGSRRGLKVGYSALCTMLFGCFWWVGLQNDISG